MKNSSNMNEYDFEFFAVSSLNAPGYRKKGFVKKCIRALEENLLEGLSTETQDIRVWLWVRVVEEINGEYWRRRGFCQCGVSIRAPKGKWHASKDFTLTKMKKLIVRSC